MAKAETETESRAGAISYPAILTKQEAADYLRVSTRYLEHAVASGRLNAYKPTRKLWRVSRKNLDAFLQSGASIAA
jgi:excisionase family DNA binding protein